MHQSQETKSRVTLERLADTLDVLKAWATQSWKISLLMMKGAYLLSERQRLFRQLGEEVFYKIERGEFQNKDLEPLVKQLSRLTKKVELEERRIRTTRFGRKAEIKPLTDPPENIVNTPDVEGTL